MLLRRSGGQVFGSDLGFGGGDDVDAASGGVFESEAAATFGPLVGLLGSTAPAKRTMAARVGVVPADSVRRRIARLRRSAGLLEQIWGHTSWEAGEGEDVVAGAIKGS